VERVDRDDDRAVGRDSGRGDDGVEVASAVPYANLHGARQRRAAGHGRAVEAKGAIGRDLEMSTRGVMLMPLMVVSSAFASFEMPAIAER
jgi:hypothetical protein